MSILWGFLNALLDGLGDFLVKYLLSVEGKEVQIKDEGSILYTNPDTVYGDLGIGMQRPSTPEGNEQLHSDASGEASSNTGK